MRDDDTHVDDDRIDELLDALGERTRARTRTDTDAVLGSIEARVARRRRAARRRSALVAAACVAVVVGAMGWWQADRPMRIDAARSATTVSTTVSTAAPDSAEGDAGEVTPPATDAVIKGQLGATLDVPGDGAQVTVIGADGVDAWVARADPVAATTPVASTVTRLSLDGTLGPTTELHGVPHFAATAAGRLWVVTEDRVMSGSDPARYRLKEIDSTTGSVRSSTALPDMAPTGLWGIDDAPVVRTATGEIAVDPATLELTQRTAPTQGPLTPGPAVRSGASAWTSSTLGSAAGVVHVAADGSSSMLELSGAGAPVPAPAWGDGAAAVLVHHPDRVDLLELRPPSVASGAPSSRARITGLPADTELVAVGTDRVWIQRQGRLAALPMS